MAVADRREADEVARRFPFLDDVLIRPVTATRLRLRLERALDTINSRRAIEQLDEALARKSQELHELNKIGVALSAERDINKLLELILFKCREITAADAGSLYLVERGKDHDRQRRRPAELRAGPERLGGASPSRRTRCRSTRPRSRATRPSRARW